MPKTYVTFGQSHIHKINQRVYDKDCIAVIDCDDATHGREIAMEVFKRTFCFSYYEDEFKESMLKYFPRGFINV